MAGIFISYRRADSDGWAGRLRDALRVRFGDRVFQDVESIADGEIFSEVIDRALQECDVALVIIGPNWATASDQGGRRLHQADDWVRTETSLVLNRRIRVIPVLVGGASMPRAEDLPEELRSLTQRQAREIRSNSWDSDVALLANHLKQIVGGTRKRPVWAYALASVAVIAGVGVFAGTKYFSQSASEVGSAPAPVAPAKSAEAPAAPADAAAAPKPAAVTRAPEKAAPASADTPRPAAAASAPLKTAPASAPAPQQPAAKAPASAPVKAARTEPAPVPKAVPAPSSKAAAAPVRETARRAGAPAALAPRADVSAPEPRNVAAAPAPRPAPPSIALAEAPVASPAAPAAPQTRAAEAAPASTPAAPALKVARAAIDLPNRPASARELKVGDSWTYRLREIQFDRNLATVTHEIGGGDKNGIRELVRAGRNAAEDGGAGTQRRLALGPRIYEQQINQDARLVEFAPFMAAYSDLRPGVKWSAIRGATSADSMNDWRFSGKVTGRERVRVPAGSFDAIKAELEGDLDQSFPSTRDPFNETTASYQTYTVWFVPEVGRAVKYERRTYNRGRRLLDHEQYELVSYRLK